jgi:hypothetical protein
MLPGSPVTQLAVTVREKNASVNPPYPEPQHWFRGVLDYSNPTRRMARNSPQAATPATTRHTNAIVSFPYNR